VDISAVVVSFNSEKFLRQNILSLLQQTVPFKRVIIVDNASRDGSRGVVESFKGLEPLYLQENIGYAAAANRGIVQAGSELVLVANADIVLDADFNRRVMEFFAVHPQAGLLSPLILRFDRETIDSAGQAYSWALHPRELRYNRRAERVVLEEKEIFSVCGAATVFSRSALEKLKVGDEFYDEDFFMFGEDFDIGWRAGLLGLRAFFAPKAVAYHFRSATLPRTWWSHVSLALARPASLRYHIVKNRYLTLIKNFRLARFWWALPFIFAKDLLWVSALTIRSPKIIIALARSGDIFKRAWEKRRIIRNRE
jgi:GT2 family glycosyltransferase